MIFVFSQTRHFRVVGDDVYVHSSIIFHTNPHLLSIIRVHVYKHTL